ncbi:hypothetical protein [Paraburkholderia sediminicola]|uniref:hypothetical protein n=1 Tax=Paraburkholderia sediminicola TaxID=458836 RepID=UPI0038BC837D
MSSLHEVIIAAGGTTIVILLVIGFVAYIARQALSSWVTRRLSRGLERDAEHFKHMLARDMEAYKDELNRTQNVERFKAEVRKTVAEKMLERRLTALHEIDLVLGEIPSWVIAQMIAPRAARASLPDCTLKLAEFASTITRHSLYFENDFTLAYRRLTIELAQYGNQWTQDAIIDAADPRALALLTQAGGLQRRVTEMHRQLPDLLADTMIDGRRPQAEAGAA